MRYRVALLAPFALLAALLLSGCAAGPTRVAGATPTEPAAQLAYIRVPQHSGVRTWEGTPVHVVKFWVGETEYLITVDRDFLIPPGTYTFGAEYDKCRHGADVLTAPFEDSGIFTPPFGRFEATVEAGVAYELAADASKGGKSGIQTRHELKVIARPVGR